MKVFPNFRKVCTLPHLNDAHKMIEVAFDFCV